MIHTTEEIAFLSDDTGIVYHHLGDGVLTGDSPIEKSDMSLLYSASSEIYPEWQDKKISTRAAATLYGISHKNIVVSDNICWIISDDIIESSKDVRKMILPFGAVVIHCANLLFGMKTEDRQIVLTMGQLSRPLTYTISLIAGQVTESILHGFNAKKVFTRTCKEVVRMDINFSSHEKQYEQYEPPDADIVKEVSLIDFLSYTKLKPIFLGEVTVPWRKMTPIVVILVSILLASKGAEYWVSKEELKLNQEISRMEKEVTGTELALKGEWRNALSFFVEKERKNFNSVFPIVDTAAQILSLRSFKVDKNNVYIELVGDITVGASEISRIRNAIEGKFKDCNTKESYTLKASNEILYSITCSY